MKELVPNRMALAAFALISFLSLTAHGQRGVQATWFDINPSQSNDGNNGGSSGRVQRVSAASDFSRVYAATEWGGLYTSRDQGNTWVRINTFSPSVTWDVKVDPRNNSRVYATSAYDGRVRGQSQSGISISDDAGDTWRPVDIPTLDTLPCALNQAQNNPSGWQIAINPNSSQFVFAGTNCGLGRSLDGGTTWTFVDPSPGDGSAEQVFAVIAQDRQTVDVLSSRGHFRSTDNGTNWSPIPGGPGPAAAGVPAGSGLAASPDESYVLFAQNGTNVWESDNGGQSWPTSLTLPLLNGGNTNVQGRVPFIKTNKLTSNQFDVWYGDINLFKTTATSPSTLAPGGSPRAPLNSWSNKQENAHWDNGDIMFDPRFGAGSCPKLFSSDGGIFLNTDPNNPSCQNPSWRQPTITPHATWIFGFDGVQSGSTHALTYGLQDNGGYAATNVAEGYSPPAPNWNNYFCCDVSNNASQPGNILSVEGSHNPPAPRRFTLEIRNPDGGGRNELSTYPSAGNFNRSTSGKQVAGFGQDAYAVNVTDGVYFTNNIKSPSWTALNAPSAAVSSGGNIKIATLNTKPNVFYQTADGNPENAGVLFVSSLVGTSAAAGANWAPINLPAGVDRVTAYDVDPNDGRRLIISGLNSATLNFEIWKTGNQGGNWTRIPQLENLMLRGAAGAGAVFVNQTVQGPLRGRSFGAYTQPSMFQFNPRDPTTIVAGAMDAGVFLSLDDGNNWQIINDPTNPTSASPPIPRPLHAYFSPGRFNANTAAFDVWVSTRGAGVRKVVIDQPPR
jgi:hypothetical protein